LPDNQGTARRVAIEPTTPAAVMSPPTSRSLASSKVSSEGSGTVNVEVELERTIPESRMVTACTIERPGTPKGVRFGGLALAK
jgi:hypothetical protein